MTKWFVLCDQLYLWCSTINPRKNWKHTLFGTSTSPSQCQEYIKLPYTESSLNRPLQSYVESPFLQCHIFSVIFNSKFAYIIYPYNTDFKFREKTRNMLYPYQYNRNSRVRHYDATKYQDVSYNTRNLFTKNFKWNVNISKSMPLTNVGNWNDDLLSL